jgi:type VI secretion system protein ImpL
MNLYFVIAFSLIFYCVLAWLAGTLLQLHGSALWLLRGGLMVIGAVAAGLFAWFHRNLKKSDAGQPAGTPGNEIALLLQRAHETLQKAKYTKSLKSFPIIFVIGEPNSAKTSSMVHSGLDPELLAGHIFRDADVVPTSSINVWLARKTIFIEVGGAVTLNAALWAELLQRTRPPRLSAALGIKDQPPRAAVVCFESAKLASSQESVITLSGRLKEMANSLGAQFPVYVIFTKLDRVRHFAEFVATLSSEESAQVFGTTLPRATVSPGIFAEEETRRLTSAFDTLLFSVTDRRLDYLAREAGADKLPGIYEFPRELKRTRNLVIQFLIDLSRPTQLGANPFLRGFYFAGVRAITVNQSVPVAAKSRTAAASASDATRMLGLAEVASSPEPINSAPAMQARKVPEWCFLPHLFTNVILRDPTLSGSSRQSTTVQQLRRLLLAATAALFLLYSLGLVISYINNRDLRLEIQATATALSASSRSFTDAADKQQLTNLDSLRASVVRLAQYQKEGPPLSYRFGLYSGDRLYGEARNIYFTNFRRLLLAPAQATITADLRQLKDVSLPADEYSDPYNSLKAYLITTQRRDQSSRNFLAPVLLERWSKARGIDAERANIALRQFEFYSDELPRENVVPTDADMLAVNHARQYLNSFNQSEKIYQKVLAEAARNNPAINFNRDFPGSSATVVNSYEVPGAFTRGGYKLMQEALRDPSRFFGGEEWVLGEKTNIATSPDKVVQDLRERYISDYFRHWVNFLKGASVVKYSSLQDASAKLKVLSGNRSTLLEVLWLAAQHTGVDSPAISEQFQPVQKVGGGSQERLIAGANEAYMNGLLGLSNNFASFATTYPHGTMDTSATGPVVQTVTAARQEVGKLVHDFNQGKAGVDGEVARLLDEPITSASKLLQSSGPGQLNAGAQAVCAQFNTMVHKFPFNASSNTEVSLDELNFFQPGSNLWAYYDSALKNVVTRQGQQFVPNQAAQVSISRQFVAFLHQAAVVTDAFFAAPSAKHASLTYTIHQPPEKGIDKLDLAIDGTRLTGQGNQSLKFLWPGDANRGVQLDIVHNHKSDPFAFSGTWGVFKFFYSAQRVMQTSNGTAFEWTIENQTQIAGMKTSPRETDFFRYEVEGPASELFRKDFFQRMSCPALSAH